MQKQLQRTLGAELVEEHELAPLFRKAWAKVVHQYIRWVIAAGRPGPDGLVSMELLGKEETLRRFELARKVTMGVIRDDGADKFGGDTVPRMAAPDGEVELHPTRTSP